MSFPTKEDLTDEMQKCFNCESDFICTGVPGTGKTVVAFHKFKDLKDQGKNVKFICFNKLLNLFLSEIGSQYNNDIKTIDSWCYGMKQKTGLVAKYFNQFFLDINDDGVKEIFTKYIDSIGYKYDWVIIDEGQDLGVNFYRNSHILADNIAVFMDDHQKLKGTSILVGDVETQLYEASGKTPHRFTLTTVFRSPKQVYEFARLFIPYDLVANDETLLDSLKETKSKVVCYPKDREMINKIFNIINEEYNIGKTVGIFADSTKEVEQIKNSICDNFGDDWGKRMALYDSRNKNNFSWEGKILFSNYDCAKGLEFDTVILMSPTKEDNDNLTANKLYTLCTRSKENLYLFMDHNL